MHAFRLNWVRVTLPLTMLCALSDSLYALPNDPQFAQQWYLQNDGQVVGGVAGTPGADIGAVEAWVIHPGTSSVTVAIVGSGVSPHEEFANRLLPGRAITGDPFNTNDVCGDGTHVAGIIGALRDNSLGVAGLAGPVKLLPVRVKATCGGTEQDLASGIEWAVDQGARVIMVPGFHITGSAELAAAVDYAVANNALVFAPLGIVGPNEVSYPAKFSGCIAVTATDHLDQLATFSYFGIEADLCAPGLGIWSTDRNGGYSEVAESAAAAAALAAGAAALIMSYAPQLTAAQVRSILESSATDLGTPGLDPSFGWGRVNLSAALQQAPAPPIRIELIADPPALLIPGAPTVFDVRIANGAQTVNAAQARVFHRIGVNPFISTLMTALGAGMYRVTLPAVPCDAELDYYLSAIGSLGGTVREPLGAPVDAIQAWAVRLRTIFHDNAELDRGWQTEPVGASSVQGAWTRGIPTATFVLTTTQVQPGYDFSPSASQRCFYTGVQPAMNTNPGAADVDAAAKTLTSPEIVLTTPDALVSYARWFVSILDEGDSPDFLTIEVSRDGGNIWTVAETVPHTGAWVEHSFRLSDFPALTGNRLVVRFTALDVGDDSLAEAAIDEFRVEAIDCSSATGDGNNDGLVALNDYAQLRTCMLGPGTAFANPTLCALFDFDADGDVDVRDAGAFTQRFGAAP